MSELQQRFADFPEFLDFRQDQLMDVLVAIQTLGAVDATDSSELLAIIRGLDLPSINRRYQSRCAQQSSGNHTLSNAIHRASFQRFKSVIGVDDFV